MDERDKEIKEENKRLRRLRFVINLTMNIIAQGDIPIEEASKMVAHTRELASRLFPGKGETFDLIYKPRFQRLIREKYRLH